MRVRGLQRLAWEWSRFKAKINKQRFTRDILEGSPGYIDRKKPSGVIDLEVISFCGAGDFPEMILSMLTFINHIGGPRRWTVYSDGTLGPGQNHILHAMPFPVTLANWDAARPTSDGDEPALLNYANAHPLGKKYFAVSHHVVDQTVLYADSDLLFYPQGRSLIARADQKQNWFLPDIPGAAALDHGLPSQWVDVPHQVNSGLMILQPGFRWSAGNGYISSRDGRWGYFTEQTAVHISMLANGAQPLDPGRFIVSVRDQFDWRQSFRLDEIAARHYVKIVRHLIWSGGWEKHFVSQDQG